MDISKTTARNIKRIRENKKMTLDAAAAATGVSRSMLSQIERGDANPTIIFILSRQSCMGQRFPHENRYIQRNSVIPFRGVLIKRCKIS